MSDGTASGTITVWGMGAEGELLPEFVKDFDSILEPIQRVNLNSDGSAKDNDTTTMDALKEAEAAFLKYNKAEKNMDISRLDLERAKNNANVSSLRIQFLIH